MFLSDHPDTEIHKGHIYSTLTEINTIDMAFCHYIIFHGSLYALKHLTLLLKYEHPCCPRLRCSFVIRNMEGNIRTVITRHLLRCAFHVATEIRDQNKQADSQRWVSSSLPGLPWVILAGQYSKQSISSTASNHFKMKERERSLCLQVGNAEMDNRENSDI